VWLGEAACLCADALVGNLEAVAMAKKVVTEHDGVWDNLDR
jgi:hypothetical protein